MSVTGYQHGDGVWPFALNAVTLIGMVVFALNLAVAMDTDMYSQDDLGWLVRMDCPSYIAVPYFYITLPGRAVGICGTSWSRHFAHDKEKGRKA